MAKSRFRPEPATGCSVANQSVLASCLLAALVGACSFDAGKLRARAPRGSDGAVETPAALGMDVADTNGDRTHGDSAQVETIDEAVAFSDLASSVDVANPDRGSLPIDLASAGEQPAPESGTASGDVPSGSDEGGTGRGRDGNGPGGGEMVGADAAGGGTGGGGMGGADAAGGGTGGGGTGGAGFDGGGTGGAGFDGGGTGGAGFDGGGAGGAGFDGGGAGDTGAPGPDPDLVLWYQFDESSGTIAADSAMFAGVARNATLATIGSGASAVFSTAKRVGSNAVVLTPSTASPNTNGAYVIVPSLADLAPDAITIAVWVNLPMNTSSQTWERVLDCGDSPTGMKWLNLMARSGDASTGPVEFAMSNIGHNETQVLIGKDALSANVWHHIAIVLPAGTTYTGTMYIDGVAVATNNAMTLHMADIGATNNNWLGRSQFSTDPFFNGSLDDFRVYKRALSKEEITALLAVR
jgi:hypothetical protein